MEGAKLTLRSLLQKQAPICAECEDQEVQSKEGFTQYEIKDENLASIWYRVVCINVLPDGKQAPKGSLLGPEGHVERMNVWSHLIAGFLYLFYVIARPVTPMGKKEHLSSSLAALAMTSFVITFFTSSTYHVYSANRKWSAYTRLGDYAGIYLGISAGTLSDLSVTSNNLKDVHWQSIADVWIGMAVLVSFFVFRRTVLSIDETRVPYMTNKCSLGLARHTNVDLEHSSFRAAAGICMAFSWIPTIPAAFDNLELDCAWMFSGSRFVGTGLLIFGMFMDNVVLYPDVWLENDTVTKPRGCVCYDDRPGCGSGWIMTSHALWHYIALASTVITSVGTEYVVASSDILDGGS